ncbi:MAG: ion transporter [Lachnospiraceae bacterium]|nr:ion transporter [Lachnospiraceae bacterium]
MKKVRSLVESAAFQNAILIVIGINSIIMGLQTSPEICAAIGPVLNVLDMICLGIFVIEILLKLVAYGIRFFTDGWNWFDLIVVVCSLISGLSFLKVLRVFRIFRVFKVLKSIKGIRAFRLVSRMDKLRLVFEAIRKSIPGISWSGALLLLIYYIFALIGTTVFGTAFPEWFGNIGKTFYTLFQVMTLESWSMGISRPVMEVFPWAWIYFVPFVLLSAFVIMNVVVGIVVNSISEVQMELSKEREEANRKKHQKELKDAAGDEKEVIEEKKEVDSEAVKVQINDIRQRLDELEKML